MVKWNLFSNGEQMREQVKQVICDSALEMQSFIRVWRKNPKMDEVREK